MMAPSGTSRKRFARTALTTAALAGLAALTACSSGPGSAAGAGASAAATGGAASAAASGSPSANSGVAYAQAQVAKYEQGVGAGTLTKITSVPDLKGKTVWYVPIGNSVPVLAAFGTAMRGALSHLGASTHICDGNFLPTAIANCLNQAATQGAAAVVTSFVDYSLIPTAYNNLVAHHIPVLVASEAPSDGRTSNSQLAFYDTNAATQGIGTIETDAAIADSNGTAHILYVNLADSSSTELATQGAKAEAAAHCPGCTFQTVDMTTAKLSQLPSAISAKLVSDPSIDYVLNSDDTFVTQISQGIRSAGAASRVKVISSAGDLAGLQRIRDKNMEVYDLGADTTMVGWYYADALLRLMAGDTIHSTGVTGTKLFYSGNIQGLELTPAAYSAGTWYGNSATWQSAFLAAWGAS